MFSLLVRKASDGVALDLRGRLDELALFRARATLMTWKISQRFLDETRENVELV